MPTDYRHRGCSTPVLRWMASRTPLNGGEIVLRAKVLPAARGRMTKPKVATTGHGGFECPDCGAGLWVGTKLEEAA